ncbi:MAG: hypothetical protein ACTSQF_10915 [Candidatus Heimdallarchaeaceae archaeon]
MAQIILSRYEIPKLVNPKGQCTITFNSNSVVGYVPLLKVFNTLSGSNDYFMANIGYGTSESIIDRIEFQSAHKVISVRRFMRRYGHHNNPRCTVSMSMLSILGIRGDIKTLYSKGLRRAEYGSIPRTTLITNSIDVFVLAMIKPIDIGTIETNEDYIKFDASKIVLYVSEEKWKNRNYLKDNYNGTLNNYLRSSVKKFKDEFGVKVEVVSDEILKTYYRNPHSIESSSLSEIMEIDKQIKNKVFSSISDKLLVDV